MPGSIVFKPIQAKLIRDKDVVSKMDPYCMFTIGDQHLKSETAQHGGGHPHWKDSILMPLSLEQSTCFIEIKDDKFLSPKDNVGSCELDLKELQMEGTVRKWYELYHDENLTGELLMESTYMYEDASGKKSPGEVDGYSMAEEQQFSKKTHELHPTQPKTSQEADFSSEPIPMPMSETGQHGTSQQMKK